MATYRVTGGRLSVEAVSGNGDEIDNTLPEGPEGPIDPGWGVSPGHPWLPGHLPPLHGNLPAPPPGIWPPPSGLRPIVPVHPDNTLPVTPGTIWPNPGRPPRPDQGLPGGQGGEINNGLPSQTFWVVCGIPGVGWRYVALDPSLVVGMPLPPHPEPK